MTAATMTWLAHGGSSFEPWWASYTLRFGGKETLLKLRWGACPVEEAQAQIALWIFRNSVVSWSEAQGMSRYIPVEVHR